MLYLCDKIKLTSSETFCDHVRALIGGGHNQYCILTLTHETDNALLLKDKISTVCTSLYMHTIYTVTLMLYLRTRYNVT